MEKKYFCCPECGTRYQTELNGRQVACKKCGNVMTLRKSGEEQRVKGSVIQWIQFTLIIMLILLTALNTYNYYHVQSQAKKYLKAFEPVIEYVTEGVEDLGASFKIATCQHNQASIESAAAIGYADNAIAGNTRYQRDMAEMVTMGILPYIPSCPDGGKYIYNSNNGTVECSLPGHRR